MDAVDAAAGEVVGATKEEDTPGTSLAWDRRRSNIWVWACRVGVSCGIGTLCSVTPGAEAAGANSVCTWWEGEQWQRKGKGHRQHKGKGHRRVVSGTHTGKQQENNKKKQPKERKQHTTGGGVHIYLDGKVATLAPA